MLRRIFALLLTLASDSTLAYAGDALKQFQDCPDCPKMITVPEGTYEIGSASSDKERFFHEEPMHSVTLKRPFRIGAFAVSFAEWDACVLGGGCNGYSPSDSDWGRNTRPVINVSWTDAQSYINWLNAKASLAGSNRHCRLPTKIEWEVAARGGQRSVYPWGDQLGKAKANCANCGANEASKTTPVGSFNPNSFGIYDPVGNVMNWLDDCYSDPLQRQCPEWR
jgi:formylglycine-generating enzyme required for sulfatase activity